MYNGENCYTLLKEKITEMKKLTLLFVACMVLFTCCSAFAEDEWTELRELTGDPIECEIIPGLFEDETNKAILGEVTDEDWSIGPEDAPLTIIEYADFQCPYCSRAGLGLIELQAEFPEQIRLVYRHFPLSFHTYAPITAYAADAAGRQGMFFDAEALLYENQDVWSYLDDMDAVEEWLYENFAALEGLDVEQWVLDFEDEELRANVDSCFNEVVSTGLVGGTPTIFLNYNSHDGGYSAEAILPYLDFFESQQNLYTSCPINVVDGEHEYRAVLDTTAGEITIDLFNDAPNAVSSFVNLALSGWYDGCNFYSILDEFMAQTGDPSGLGITHPGYSFANDHSEYEYGSFGMVGMANSGVDTNGAQFFITYDLNEYYAEHLIDMNPDISDEDLLLSVGIYLEAIAETYPIFGQITEDSFEAFAAVDTDTVINDVTIYVK